MQKPRQKRIAQRRRNRPRLPSSVGDALGFDRLVTISTDAASFCDVIRFHWIVFSSALTTCLPSRPTYRISSGSKQPSTLSAVLTGVLDCSRWFDAQLANNFGCTSPAWRNMFFGTLPSANIPPFFLRETLDKGGQSTQTLWASVTICSV